MSAKTMFCRIFRIPQAPETNEWITDEQETPSNVRADGDAATIPMNIRTADPGEIDQMTDTTVIDAIVDTHTDMIAFHLESAIDDTDFKNRATTALKLGNVNDVVAGLLRYVSQHPFEALEAVAA